MFHINYWVWPGVLPVSLCNSIINEGDHLHSSDGLIGGNNNIPGQYNTQVRDTNISFFDTGHWIEGICVHYATSANTQAKWDINISYPQNVQYARYFPEQHYSVHNDDLVSPENEEMRKLSVAIQISNPTTYQGGEFGIENTMTGEINIVEEFKPQGSVIVFPSVIRHGVQPVISGVRHSVVCWIVGPKYK